MVDKKLVASTVSSREKKDAQKKLSSRAKEKEEKDIDQRKSRGSGGGRQKIESVDGDMPVCLMDKMKEVKEKTKEADTDHSIAKQQQRQK